MVSFYVIIVVMREKYICINIIYLLIALCLFFDILYIVFNAKKKNIIGVIVKVLAALCFIAIGNFGYLDSKTIFSYYVLLGLLFDGIGDLFLGLRNIFGKNVNFLVGSLCFIAGHVMYIRALFLLENQYLIACIIVGVFLAAGLFYLFAKACRINKIFTVVGIAYTSIIMIMVTMSVGVYLSNQIDSNLIFMIGACLFLSSDSILILYNFSKKEKWMHPIYSVLYFVAQILISYSLLI